MYVTTFYSYKGGVGRTMALVNVATLLANAGKRVLVVDFDLEAPGIPSYAPFSCADGLPGVVDYVEEYRRDLVAPRAADFIVECKYKRKPLWVMPAGASNSVGYTERLNSIDWQELYSRESGYLMFEDLKQQWAQFEGHGFDYVFIDSRTGHTDVGGICTRQLPDAVVVFFVPTPQNLDGLAPIVRGIRTQKEQDGRIIRIHFCPSNLPDEYDEDGILAKLLEHASDRLGYKQSPGLTQPPTQIHHWTAVGILETPLVVSTRPRSKLSKEYEELRTAIILNNLSDRDGALENLERLPELYEKERIAGDSRAITEISSTLQEIVRLHPEDGEIAIRAAEAFNLIGEYEQEVAQLSVAIEAGVNTTRARFLRAVSLVNLQRTEDALDDLKRVISAADGTNFEFRPAVQLLRGLDPNAVETARKLFKMPTTRMRARLQLAPLLTQEGGYFDLVADVLLKELKRADLDPENRVNVTNALVLALIAAGRLQEVLDEAIPVREGLDVALAFNRAVAEWGISGSPPLDLFTEVNAELASNRRLDANGHQCFAVVLSVLDRSQDAIAEIERARTRAATSSLPFSCWTYHHGSRKQLLADLNEMEDRAAAGVQLRPPVLDRIGA